MASTRKRTWTSNGRERAAWVVDYLDGAGKRRLKSFATKKAADAWSVQALHQVASGTHTPERSSATVATAARAWIRRCEVERLESSTLRQYQSHIATHIIPTLGDIRLPKLSAPRVEAFVSDMLATRSRALTRKVLTSLRAILATAQRQGLVAQNVALAARVSAQDRHEEKVEILTPDEVRVLVEKAPASWRPFLLVAIFTGLRASELRGLRWADVDLDAGKLTVAQRADERGRLGSPKSASSRRTVPLPPSVVAALKVWQRDAPASELGLVFPNGAGRPESLANLKNRQWGPLQLACGITTHRKGRDGAMADRPRYGLHVLRHFYASWLIDQGFPPKRVQALMGHSTITLTLDLYGHLWPDDEADAVRMAAAETALLTTPPRVLRDMDATNSSKALENKTVSGD